MKQSNVKTITVGEFCQYNFKSSSLVEMKEEFSILTDEGEITLDVSITADFEEIPEEYREIFINMMTTKYMNRVVLSDNLFSKYKKSPKRTWFQKFKALWNNDEK